MMRRKISLSETIQITVITENEKQEQQEIKVTHDSGMTLMTTLLKKKLISGNFCGGRGTCKRCRVRFIQAPPLPTSLDRQAFTPDELRRGYRLACMAKPGKDCIVRLELVQSREIEILTEASNVIDVSEKNDRTSQEKITPKRYMIAVDLGTTTIAMQLMDIDSGQAVDTYCAMNPQRSYGADVLSRIQAANGGQAGILQESVWEVLLKGIGKFSRFCHAARQEVSERTAAEPEGSGQELSGQELSLCCMCIAGNTTMEHLLMGLSTEGLGKSPFTPAELGLQRCVLTGRSAASEDLLFESVKEELHMTDQVNSDRLPVYITPGISAFVGGDITAGLYALKMLPVLQKNDVQNTKSTEYRGAASGQGAVLFIDLGTNGEMAITDGERMIVTATAAGPAFEGGPGRAVAGSDMVAVTAFLLREGIIDETGLMAEPYFEKGISVSLSDAMKVSGSSGTVCLTQKDIRDLQMAKAAVRAGVEILWRKMGWPEISRVCLAGGFGYYLNVDAAAAIGLLPEKLKPCTKAVGNTSLAGAFQMGRDLWTGKLLEETLAGMMQGIESINLAAQEDFEKLYIRYMDLKSS